MWTTTTTVTKIKTQLELIKTILDSMLQGNRRSIALITEIKRSVAMISKSNELSNTLTKESNCIVGIDDFEDFITEYTKAQDTLKASFKDDSLVKKLYAKVLNLFDNFETVHTIKDGSNSINDSNPSNLDKKYSNFLKQQATFRENLTKIIDAIKCLNTFIIEKDEQLAKKRADEKAAAATKKAEDEAAAAKKRADEKAKLPQQRRPMRKLVAKGEVENLLLMKIQKNVTGGVL